MEESVQQKNVEKDYSILVFRILGMLFILLCHIGTAINSGIIAQTFEVGVQFFLFISGYLYANKTITSAKSFLIKRYIKVTIPCLILVVICLIVNLILSSAFSWYSLLLYVTNTQGYYHLFEFIPNIQLINGTQHLWFITVLFVCYLIMLCVKKVENKQIGSTWKVFISIIAVLITFVGAYFGARLDYVLVFFLGYYFKKFAIKTNIRSLLISFAIMVMFSAARLVLKKYCDENGDIPLYTQLAIPLAYIAITVFAYIFIKYIVDFLMKYEKAKTFLQSKFLAKIDEISFFIYIGHYILLVDEISIFNYDINLALKIIIFLAETIVFSFILYYLNKVILYIFDIIKYKMQKNKEST